MFRGKRIAVVVPAYNEASLIVDAIEQIPGYVDDVIVVDDASTDETYERVRTKTDKPGLRCLRHEVNRGVGGAIVTGYKRALELGTDVVAVMAGDAQMDPVDLPCLLEPVVSGHADYSKGDRLSWPGVFEIMPLARFLGNHLFSLLTRFTSGYTQVRDSQCGYTAISARVLNRLNLDDLYQRYGFPNDLLAHLHTAGARLAQVSVRPIYKSEKSGISVFTALFGIPYVMLSSMWKRWRRAVALSLARPAQPKS